MFFFFFINFLIKIYFCINNVFSEVFVISFNVYIWFIMFIVCGFLMIDVVRLVVLLFLLEVYILMGEYRLINFSN